MKISIVSWNGVDINDGTPFTSYIPSGQLTNLQVSPVLVNRADDYPALVSATKQGSALVIGVIIAAGQNINTNREYLKQVFFADTSIHTLVIEDEADGDKQYYRSGIPIRLTQESPEAQNSFFVTIQTEYPYWQLVTPATDTWNITATAQTHAVANSGNLPVRPVITLTPTTTKTQGLKYRRYVPIYNKTDATYSGPFEITNGGLDTDALIPTKMMTSGDDLTVWMDGGPLDRWISGINTTATKVWSNISLGPAQVGVISSQLGSTATTMSFSETRANKTFLTALQSAANYTLLVGSEAVVFDPANIDLINYQITGVVRGEKNTTAATHSASSNVRLIDHDLWIMYGDSAATAPDVDDDNEPIFDLSSTNETWNYTYYNEPDLKRPGSWKGEVKSTRTRLSYCFTGDQNTFEDPNPATKLGLAERSAQDFTVPHETAVLSWQLNHPAGITSVTYSGDKYRTGSWPGVVGLQKLQPNTVWLTEYNEAQPSTALTWEPFGPRTEDLSGTYPAVRFVIDGTLSSAIGEMAMAQFDTVSVSFSTAALPAISVGSEGSINFFDIKLTNVTTGEWLKIKTPCPVNTDLVIDCETKTAYLEDGRIVPVTLSSDRAEWLNLVAGSNTLKFEDAGTVAVTLVTAHRDKVL